MRLSLVGKRYGKKPTPIRLRKILLNLKNMFWKCSLILRVIFIWGMFVITPLVTLLLATTKCVVLMCCILWVGMRLVFLRKMQPLSTIATPLPGPTQTSKHKKQVSSAWAFPMIGIAPLLPVILNIIAGVSGFSFNSGSAV